MLKVSRKNETKKIVEHEVIQTLRKREYSLNTVNTYGESLLHISAANGCNGILKEIFKTNGNIEINRKNKFGWTPLMQAIRNGNLETVKILLNNKCDVNVSNYFGLSAMALAAVVNSNMFEVLYNACPSALEDTLHDDITPLCTAALKNNKELFFRLLNLGFDVSKANEYTHLTMRRSTIPEIAAMAIQKYDMEDYWLDCSDNIEIIRKFSTSSNTKLPGYLSKKQMRFAANSQNIFLDVNGNASPFELTTKFSEKSLLSPTLTYNLEAGFPQSPIFEMMYNNYTKHRDKELSNKKVSGTHSSTVLPRLQQTRPPDISISRDDEDPNASLNFVPEFSPNRSPHVPADINDENAAFGESTPTPPHCKTPPKGMVLNSQQAKMVVLLKQCGLEHHAPIFLREEVDVELFLTLTEDDLIEIGIDKPLDRKELLAVIHDYKKNNV